MRYLDILYLWMLFWCDYVVWNLKFRLRIFFLLLRYENWIWMWNLFFWMFVNFIWICWNVKYLRRKVCFFKVYNYDIMWLIRNIVLFFFLIIFLKILYVVGFVLYIIDNSLEWLNLDDGKWVGVVIVCEILWVEVVYVYVKKLNCSDIFFIFLKEC